MPIRKGSIVAMRVILLSALKAVRVMSEADFHREKLYQMTMSLLGSMLSDGLISSLDYQEAERLMLEKYQPVLGKLFSTISLT